jgi:hypothetical protein
LQHEKNSNVAQQDMKMVSDARGAVTGTKQAARQWEEAG